MKLSAVPNTGGALWRRLIGALDLWIESITHDESIGYAEAAEVALAKMHNETATRKRQRVTLDKNQFTVTTYYEVEHAGSIEHKHMAGIPHVEVFPFGSVKVGCISFPREVIAKMYALSHSEPHVHQFGYMQKDPKRQ